MSLARYTVAFQSRKHCIPLHRGRQSAGRHAGATKTSMGEHGGRGKGLVPHKRPFPNRDVDRDRGRLVALGAYSNFTSPRITRFSTPTTRGIPTFHSNLERNRRTRRRESTLDSFFSPNPSPFPPYSLLHRRPSPHGQVTSGILDILSTP
jgi:hypothetical protein